MRLLPTSLVLFLALTSCATTPIATESSQIVIQPAIEAVKWDEISNYWVVEWGSGRGMFQKAKRTHGGCVIVGFIIESDGSTNTHRIIGSFPDDALDEVIIDWIKKSGFTPAITNPDKTAVYTVFVTGMYQTRNFKKDESSMMAVNGVCKNKAEEYWEELDQENLLSI